MESRGTAHIGGLHSAYQYCAADYVPSVKETSPWERDAKVVDELETDRNIVVTTDHSEEAAVPFITMLTSKTHDER